MVTIPRERPFGTVAGLVLGGVAARHELTLDALDDLQLALEALLDREEDGEVNVVLRVEPRRIEASVGPFGREHVAELEQESGEGRLGLRRLLATVVDTVSLRDGDGGCWVELGKNYSPAGAA